MLIEDEDEELIMIIEDALDWPPIPPASAAIMSLPLLEPSLCSPMSA